MSALLRIPGGRSLLFPVSTQLIDPDNDQVALGKRTPTISVATRPEMLLDGNHLQLACLRRLPRLRVIELSPPALALRRLSFGPGGFRRHEPQVHRHGHLEHIFLLRHHDRHIRRHPRLQSEIFVVDAHHDVVGYDILHIDRSEPHLVESCLKN